MFYLNWNKNVCLNIVGFWVFSVIKMSQESDFMFLIYFFCIVHYIQKFNFNKKIVLIYKMFCYFIIEAHITYIYTCEDNLT